jgi:biotin-dependent carboxylase-like uncharacterized protein
MIRVVKPGLATTVQDLGRFGFAHLGLSPCGAADPLSFRIANLLVGNNENSAALEMTLLGATLEFERNAVVAVTGAECNCKIGNYRAPMFAAVEVPAGGVLHCGSATKGARFYLAVQGGIDVPIVMGSAATDGRAKFGGFEGRALRVSDLLRVGARPNSRLRVLRGGALDRLKQANAIRVTRGAQADWFADETFARFVTTEYRVTEQADRAGIRLAGESVMPREHRQLLTDGIPLGAVQVPQDGQPIILFVDQQPTRGYPKIANIIAADMHRIGQLRPRDEIRFAEVSFDEAVDALRAQELWLKTIWRD